MRPLRPEREKIRLAPTPRKLYGPNNETASGRNRRKRREAIDRAQPNRRRTPGFLTRSGRNTTRGALDLGRAIQENRRLLTTGRPR